MKRKFFFIALVVILIAGALAYREFSPSSTPPIEDENGNILSNSISELEKVEIGGMMQWIQIRGENTANPVLLWLHGGPGSAQMPIARHFNQELEKDFIVVHWDQRGAGKSNPQNFNEKTMTFDQYLADTYQLTQYLKQKLNKEKIYLLGHSWGTKIGITMAEKHPEDYYAYIGISQIVENKKAQEIAYDWLLSQISQSDSRDLEKLKQIGDPPYFKHEKYIKFIKMIDSYGGGMDVSMAKLAFIAIQAKEYRLSDLAEWLDGANRGSGPMWDTYFLWDAAKEVPEVDIPVYFFSGKNDYNTPLQLVKEYYEALEAPYGKNLIIFEDSSHTPFMQETDKFYQEMLKVKNQTYADSLKKRFN